VETRNFRFKVGRAVAAGCCGFSLVTVAACMTAPGAAALIDLHDQAINTHHNPTGRPRGAGREMHSPEIIADPHSAR